MHVRPMQPIRVVPRLLVVGAFHADERPEVRGVRIGQLQNDAPPNGTTNQCRLFELERLAKRDRKSTRLNSSHVKISYAVFCLKKKINKTERDRPPNDKNRAT